MIKGLKSLKSILSRNIINVPGWRSDRKIVVIESDDWGSIRMPTKEVYKKFIEKGFDISGSNYNRFDTLESNEDLELLFDMLQSVKNRDGESPVITANIVTGNPDFERIRESDFNDYFIEPVSTTLSRYEGRDRVESLWREGNRLGIFHPQFHGREHVNVVRWMNALRKRSPEIMFTFDNCTTFSGNGDYNFMEVLDYDSPEDMIRMKESLADGLDDFERLFGYRSKSFIPPCYSWDSEVEATLAEKGVKYIQGLIVQMIPTGKFDHYKKKYHYLGKQNSFGQYYLVRNCFFEPSLSGNEDFVNECLDRITTAFRWNKPAVICTHRLNYMGSLDPVNRSKNLELLGKLLAGIVRRWPDVEFLSSDQLGDIISGEVTA